MRTGTLSRKLGGLTAVDGCRIIDNLRLLMVVDSLPYA